jgi:hypothetical protein
MPKIPYPAKHYLKDKDAITTFLGERNFFGAFSLYLTIPTAISHHIHVTVSKVGYNVLLHTGSSLLTRLRGAYLCFPAVP